MRVAGVDLSTFAIDVVTIPIEGADWLWLHSDETPTWYRFELTGNDAWERTRSVRGAMPPRGADLWDDVLAFGIENPQARGKRAQNISLLHRVSGAVLVCLPERTLVHPWQPAEWRKKAGLKGNAKKSEIADALTGTPWNLGWPQDACDAYFLAVATMREIEVREIRLPT